jgi:hypothetical protein
MRRLLGCTVVVLALQAVAPAEQVMRVTLRDSVSDQSLATLSRVVFVGDDMVAGATYDLDQVLKIEFYDDAVVAVAQPGRDARSGASPAMQRPAPSLNVSGGSLEIALPARSHIRVCVFSVNGAMLGELYRGAAEGVVRMPLGQLAWAAGVYCVMLRSGNEVFARTITVN